MQSPPSGELLDFCRFGSLRVDDLQFEQLLDSLATDSPLPSLKEEEAGKGHRPPRHGCFRTTYSAGDPLVPLHGMPRRIL